MSLAASEEEKGPIRLPCLESNEIPAGVPFKLRYTFPEVDHPIYGKALGLTGELNFLLPSGSYPVTNFFKMTKTEQNLFLKHATMRRREWFEVLDNEEVSEKILGYVVASALGYPRLLTTSTQFEVLSDIVCIGFIYDDFYEKENVIPVEFNTKLLYKNYGKVGWEYLMSDNYERLAEIGSGLPGLESLLEILIAAVEKAKKVLPAFDTKHLIRRAFQATEATILKLERGSENFTEEGRRYIRLYDALMLFIAELGIQLHDIHLPVQVRQSLLFNMFLEGVGHFGAQINEILGLKKDIETSDTIASLVLCRVVKDKISLSQAFVEESKRLQNISQDIRISGQKLLDAFPEEKTVPPFVQLCLENCDGQIYAYMWLAQANNRYGSIQMEILPLDSE